INIVSVQINGVQWQLLAVTTVATVVVGVAAHLEFASGDEDHFAGVGRNISIKGEILTRCIWWQVYKSPFRFKGIP
ncbi:MAG: hypothetical protein MUO67_07775, partial [Anaerolineales bacterium]|nr:hypothetical protein [Anaerolineales bacterium]